MYLNNSLDVRSWFFFLRVAFENKFSGASLCFLVLLRLLVFLWCFANVFVLCFGFSLQDTFWKNSLDVSSSFCGKEFLLQDLDFCFACFFFFGFSPGNAGVNFLLVRSGFLRLLSDNFRERTSVSRSRFQLCVFWCLLAMVCTVFRLFSRKCFSCQGSGFCNHWLFQRALSLSLSSVGTSSCRQFSFVCSAFALCLFIGDRLRVG